MGTPMRPSLDLAEQLRRARREGGALLLPPQVLIRLSGNDAFRYLNGQITRELHRLKSGEILPSCLLTPKGRLCAPLLIHQDGKDLLVEVNPILQESLISRLERYIVADDVSLSIEQPREILHLFGALVLEKWRHTSGLCVTRLGVQGRDVDTVLISGEKPPLLDPRVVETLRIERGIPAWGLEMTEETLPPEVGLDLTHIDYDRGCYPGQEIISRLKSIGRVNRLLHRLVSGSSKPIRPGMIVQNQEQQEIGRISSAAEQWDTGFWVALAILPRGTQENAHTLFALDPLTGETSPLSIIKIHAA